MYLFHTLFNTFRVEKRLIVSLLCNLSIVLQQNGTYGFGWVCHVDGPVIPLHLCEVWESTTMVQVEVTYYETINVFCVRALRCNITEVWKLAFIVITHVYPTVQHKVFPLNSDQNTAPPHVLSRPQWDHFDIRH